MGRSIFVFPPKGGGNHAKEFFMKNRFKILGIIALVAVMVSVTGCVTASSIGGTGDGHGLFSGGAARTAVTEGATEIASYSVILMLFDAGYADYAAKVKSAEASGKQITTTTTWYFGIFSKITAYAK
jgi:hypothetical protein